MSGLNKRDYNFSVGNNNIDVDDINKYLIKKNHMR